MKKTMVRRSLLGATALSLLAPLVGCAASESATNGLTDMSFRLEFSPSGKFAPYYYADSEGYYKDEGLDVSIQPGKGSVVTGQEITAGKVDIGSMACSTMALQVGQGADLVSVGLTVGKLSLTTFVPEDSDASTAYDLEGKQVIVTAASLETPLMPALFALGDINGDRVELMNVDAASKVSTYAAGRGDAVVTSLPLSKPTLDKERPSKALLWADAGMSMPDFCLVTTQQTLEEREDDIEAFLRATYRGFKDATANPEDAVAELTRAEPAAASPTAQETFELWSQFYCSDDQVEKKMPFGQNSSNDWQQGVELLKEHAELAPDVESDSLFDNRFFTERNVSDVTCS